MNFDDMMNRAQTTDLKKDREVAEKYEHGTKKRYECLVFPAYHGKPVTTDSFVWAHILTFFRSIGYAEGRIIDTKTGEHFVL